MVYVLRISFIALFSTVLILLSLRQLGLSTLPSQSNSWFDTEKPWLIAAQGAYGLAPGHTKLAFRKVQNLSNQIILEIELKRSLDGYWLLYGHERLEKQTEAKGFVAWKKWEELKNLNLGHHYKNQKGEFPFRKKNKKLKFILFEDFLKNYHKTFILRLDLKDTYGYPDLIKMIEKHKKQKQVIFSLTRSSSYKYLKTQKPDWRFLVPQFKTPFLLTMKALYLEPLIRLEEPVFLAPFKLKGKEVFSQPFVTQLQRLGKKAFVRVEGESQVWPEFAQGLVTPYPDKFLGFLKSLKFKNKKD